MAESAAEEFDRLWQAWQRSGANAVTLERMNALWRQLTAQQRHEYNLKALQSNAPQRRPES